MKKLFQIHPLQNYNIKFQTCIELKGSILICDETQESPRRLIKANYRNCEGFGFKELKKLNQLKF